MHHHHEVAYDMMQHRDTGKVHPDDYNAQAIKATKLKEVFQEFAGEDFVFYVPCDRDNDMCNSRRLADSGKNHVHAIEIDPPTAIDVNTMEEAVQLRKQCQALGISPCTGPVPDITTRCEIYRERIARHFEALQKSAEAKRRLDVRHVIHKEEKAKVGVLANQMLVRQSWSACQLNMIEQVLTVVHRGGSPNEESPSGVTPISCLVINDAPVEKLESLLGRKNCNINASNRHGLTPLMIAARMNNVKMVHVLMRNGASALQKVGR